MIAILVIDLHADNQALPHMYVNSAFWPHTEDLVLNWMCGRYYWPTPRGAIRLMKLQQCLAHSGKTVPSVSDQSGMRRQDH